MTEGELKHLVDLALIEAGPLYRLDDLIVRARERQTQIFANDDALIATEVYAYPLATVLDCTLAAGTLPGMLALEDQVEAFAREAGCSRMWCHGRPGWGRVGEPRGWRLKSLMYEKGLVTP